MIKISFQKEAMMSPQISESTQECLTVLCSIGDSENSVVRMINKD